MSVVQDILRSYRAPGDVVLKRLSGVTESTALANLMGATLLIFAAQWPSMGREAHFDPSIPFEARIGAAILGVLFIFPLVSYVISGVIWVVLRLFRPIGGLPVRFAFFWAMLAATPLWLAHGFLKGFLGTGVFIDIVGILVILAFLWVLFGGLRAIMTEIKK